MRKVTFTFKSYNEDCDRLLFILMATCEAFYKKGTVTNIEIKQTEEKEK